MKAVKWMRACFEVLQKCLDGLCACVWGCMCVWHVYSVFVSWMGEGEWLLLGIFPSKKNAVGCLSRWVDTFYCFICQCLILWHTFAHWQVIIIQKYYRRWLAKRYVEIVRENERRRREWERQAELNKIREKEERIKREFERRMNPKTKEDFDLLYHALESTFYTSFVCMGACKPGFYDRSSAMTLKSLVAKRM